MRRHWLRSIIAGASLALLAGASQAADFAYGYSEEDTQLKQLDRDLLEVQRQRFAARFFPGESESRDRLDERFKKLQKQRRKLLRDTGRVY